jgi:RNA-directed DNA polymerase
MNGRRKSDKPVVATKSPNKAGVKPAEEGMEPRGLAKGKSVKQNMDRIQSRKTMQSALERVRRAARKDKDHHSYPLRRFGVIT